jgi:4-hydroxybenzoate polyprenyltransferase
MSKLVSALAFSLVPFLAYAAVQEPAPPPPPDTSPWAMIIFLLLFVGMIVGFFIYMWVKDRNRKREGGQ